MARLAPSTIRHELRKSIPERLVNEMARETGALKRNRKVKIYALVCALVLGFACGRKRTLATLRRSYERAAGHAIEESAFYKRFTPGLATLMKRLVARVFDDLVGAGRRLQGPLAGFRDVLLTDSTVVRLHELLAKAFPACRTNHTKAALKAHVILSVSGAGDSSVKITSERRHDGPVFTVGRWVKDRLLLFDLGYYRFQLFDCIRRNGGFFITRLKKGANPRIVGINRKHRGRAVDLIGKRLGDVIAALDREVLDVQVEVEFSRRVYAGRRRRARRVFRVIGVKDAATGHYHLYITNIPVDRIAAEDVAIVYSLRWQVELLFKELKTHFRLEDMPSRKRVVVEVLLYSALLTLVVSRRVLAAVRTALRNASARIPPLRWAAVFAAAASDLLVIVTRRLSEARSLLRDVARMMVHEALDPNLRRHDLLCAVETGRRHRRSLTTPS